MLFPLKLLYIAYKHSVDIKYKLLLTFDVYQKSKTKKL